MSVPPTSVRSAPPALSAFLRGVERRGAVLAELQAGDAMAGDAALVQAMARFRAEAESTPMAAWPTRFWGLLLTQPQLRQRTQVALAIEATDRLGELGSGPRAALLLRVAAGLSDEDAAEVLGLPESSYRLALQRALPHHPDGRADPSTWQQLRDQIHRRIKTLPPDRLVRLSNAREAALRGEAGPVAEARALPTTARRRPRWLMPLLWGLLGVCVLALAATFWRWGGDLPGMGASGRVDVEPLPEGGAPASRYGDELAIVAHRDFALLADAQGQADARDLEFRSWFAAQQAAGVERPTPPADLPGDTTVPPSPVPTEGETEAGAETSDAP